MTQSTETYEFVLKPRQFLGPPRIMAPPKDGFVTGAIQFVIPGLVVGQQVGKFKGLARYCGDSVEGIEIERVSSERTQHEGTLVCLTYYVPQTENINELTGPVQDTGRLLLERFVGVLTFTTGVRFGVDAAQVSTSTGGDSVAVKLPVSHFVQSPKIDLKFDSFPLPQERLTDEVYSALFWLRRGLAARDELETFSSLMVCLQSVARSCVRLPSTQIKCKKCGDVVETRGPSITALTKELVVGCLGEGEESFSRIWKARNAVVAHGNETVSAATFLKVTELKLDAIKLCFRGIKYALGMPVGEGPHAHQVNFVSPAEMHVD